MSSKKYVLSVVLILTIVLSACSGISQPSDDQIAQEYISAREAMMWFQMATMPTDDEQPNPSDGSAAVPENAHKVNHPTIKTYDDLKKHLQGLFSDAITESLLSDNMYFDINGELYVIAAARGSDISKGEEAYQIVRENSKKIIYRVTVEDLSDDHTTVTGHTVHDMIYEYTGGKWVFTSFELVR